MANVNIRVDDSLKHEAEEIFSAIGLSMSAATNAFYRQVVRYGGIPFELRIDPFFSGVNQEYLKKSINDYETGKSKPVIKSFEELEALTGE